MRVIKCDRCNKEINETDTGKLMQERVFTVKFSPMPKNISNAESYFELCERCFDIVYKDATRPREEK